MSGEPELSAAFAKTRDALVSERNRIAQEIAALMAEDNELALTLRVMERFWLVPKPDESSNA